MTTTISERDKKLLFFLGCFVLVALFAVIGFQLLNANDEVTTEMADKEIEQMQMEAKVARLSGATIEAEETAKLAASRLADFYPLMQSQEIDKEITQLALHAGLKVENMTITMPTEPLWIIPYANSEMAQAPAADVTAETEAAEPEVGASDVAKETELIEEELAEENLPAVNAPEGALMSTKTMYKSDIQMTVSGNQSQFWKFIDALSNPDKSLRISQLSMRGLQRDTDENEQMDITIEVYMCSGDVDGTAVAETAE